MYKMQMWRLYCKALTATTVLIIPVSYWVGKLGKTFAEDMLGIFLIIIWVLILGCHLLTWAIWYSGEYFRANKELINHNISVLGSHDVAVLAMYIVSCSISYVIGAINAQV